MKDSLDSDQSFENLQSRFASQYQKVFEDNLALKTIIVIPSLTLDHEILSKIKGHFYYEERMLCMLMLLKMPETRLTFITSIPISPLIIDYYLHMLPGITPHHARERLTLLNCYDAGNLPLTQKILQRPRLIARIKKSIMNEEDAHLVFFNVTEEEKKLALKLNVPIYGCNPSLNYLGTKSGSRKLFRECNIPLPYGVEDVYTKSDVIEALLKLYIHNQSIKKAVIKINEGFSGDGNAVFYYDGISGDLSDTYQWVESHLKKNLKIVAKKLKHSKFFDKLQSEGGIVETFVEGDIVVSPSVQCRINPLGEIVIISTHDQVLSGENKQVFVGATFPANNEYSAELSALSYKLADVMKNKGVLGRFGIDFMSVKTGETWEHFAIEINLRKGGTTHPFIMLQYLTDGHFDVENATFTLPNGSSRFYFATDNLYSHTYKGLTPLDLIDIVMHHGLHYNHNREEGVMFHLISALSQYGKIGLVSIGSTPERAIEYFEKVVDVLNKEVERFRQD